MNKNKKSLLQSSSSSNNSKERDLVTQNNIIKSFNEIYVTTVKLNLRSGPDLLYPIITKMPKGSVVVCHKYLDNWSQVEYENYHGYCMSSFLIPLEE